MFFDRPAKSRAFRMALTTKLLARNNKTGADASG
jgi:hypothetical protein